MYTLAIGSDHRGYNLKKRLIAKEIFGDKKIVWHDVGTDSSERTDYPLYTNRVVDLILSKKVDYGILLCGSGIGVSIAANRHAGIYAGLVWNETVAQLSKEHDNCNLLILPADFMIYTQACACINSWLSAEFKQGRYGERLKMIDQ